MIYCQTGRSLVVIQFEIEVPSRRLLHWIPGRENKVTKVPLDINELAAAIVREAIGEAEENAILRGTA